MLTHPEPLRSPPLKVIMLILFLIWLIFFPGGHTAYQHTVCTVIEGHAWHDANGFNYPTTGCYR